jgi:hypothetical protein
MTKYSSFPTFDKQAYADPTKEFHASSQKHFHSYRRENTGKNN